MKALIEETEAWLAEHKLHGRELEALAAELRLKTLLRCQQKAHKPKFISDWYFKVDGKVVELRHLSRRNENTEHYVDDVLLNHVIREALVAAWKALYPNDTEFPSPYIVGFPK